MTTDFAAAKAMVYLPEGVIYLDGNSLGPMPAAVKQRMARVVRCLIPRFDGVILSMEWKEGLRDRFRRRNALLANSRAGPGAAAASHEDPDRHHLDVLDGLFDPRHPLTRTVLRV